MYIDLNQKKYINSYYVKTMEREGSDVYFRDKHNKILGIKSFNTVEQAEAYCEEEFCRKTNLLAEIAYQIENMSDHMSENTEHLYKEIRQIREVLYFVLAP
ncbi:hypothetical protein [Cellulosilyticum lentocellum]|uniref:Uncharacterized protein n=1 Tax=Cellulosilyticum lentocellum (strain ATCC 49066 / DSM 5427 / NCIMB 11756 / RHM5) TaxID=642492 RepID=F2JIF8_CELLD|nr:hypothetical protein [Cellulosilyticum lentocellum]ADZ84324.1 hypothetical protein Clole_2623 [Cellulosilyticum lentocellum DSM 5427]